jgi:hypothetical protein
VETLGLVGKTPETSPSAQMVSKHLFVVVLDSFRSPGFWDPTKGSRFAPSLTSLVKKGAISLPLVASSSWTLPSHFSLLGGREPWESTSQTDTASHTSLAEQWKTAGGTTAAWSANPMLLSSHGPLADFDQLNRGVGIAPIKYTARLGGLFDAVAVPFEIPVPSAVRGSRGRPAPGWPGLLRATYEGMRCVQSCLLKMLDGRHIVRALARFAQESRFDRPTLAFINLMETHEPYLDVRSRNNGKTCESLVPSSNYSYHSRLVSNYCADTGPLHAAYTNAVTKADNRVRDLLALLERSRVLDASTIVILSDHGQSLGEHHFFGHARYLYDELIRVPCIILSPELRGRRENAEAIGEFVDHRHIFNLISSFVHTPPDPGSVESQLQSSVDKIGPATSFYRGRPFCENAILARGPEYWLLRLISRNGAVQIDSRGSGAAPDEKPIGTEADDYTLGWVDKALDSIGKNPSAAIDDMLIPNRLLGWGYA